ncbi:MAG TPA: hypothetical protein VFD92_01030 [Candidatus Binatia bacterium]|nr:hypothetical protein [Candidatus Binatia bacterium]
MKRTGSRTVFAAHARARIGRALGAALPVALALLARPDVAAACAVCFGDADSDWPAAFLAGTIVMLALPPAILVTAGFAIYRATKRQEARQEARRAGLPDDGDRGEPHAQPSARRPLARV